jgi:hypothetical protein
MLIVQECLRLSFFFLVNQIKKKKKTKLILLLWILICNVPSCFQCISLFLSVFVFMTVQNNVLTYKFKSEN